MKKVVIMVMSSSVFFTLSSFCGAAFAAADTLPTSPIFSKLLMAVEQISGWLIGLSTAAALIGIVTGQLMIKLSFGSEEQIIKGKRLTKNVIWAYAIVAGSSLILKAIDSFVK